MRSWLGNNSRSLSRTRSAYPALVTLTLIVWLKLDSTSTLTSRSLLRVSRRSPNNALPISLIAFFINLGKLQRIFIARSRKGQKKSRNVKTIGQNNEKIMIRLHSPNARLNALMHFTYGVSTLDSQLNERPVKVLNISFRRLHSSKKLLIYSITVSKMRPA